MPARRENEYNELPVLRSRLSRESPDRTGWIEPLRRGAALQSNGPASMRGTPRLIGPEASPGNFVPKIATVLPAHGRVATITFWARLLPHGPWLRTTWFNISGKFTDRQAKLTV